MKSPHSTLVHSVHCDDLVAKAFCREVVAKFGVKVATKIFAKLLEKSLVGGELGEEYLITYGSKLCAMIEDLELF